jgi:hypothetical protein
MATAFSLDDAYANMAGPVEIVDAPQEAPKPEYPPELLSWLQSEEENAKDTKLDEQRALALSFYNGELFGDEEAGRSQIVTRDVAEVVDYMVPSVLRTMVSGDRVVEFEALDSGFKDLLEEATEAVSQQFMQDQRGWLILHDSLKAGLLEKTGAIKSYVEEKKTPKQEEVTATRLAQLREQGIEPTRAEPTEAFSQMLATMPPEQQAMFLDPPPEMEAQVIAQLDQLGPIMRVEWIETAPTFVDIPVPNEELQVAKDARDLETSPYYAHVTNKTLSEIREMGLDDTDLEYNDGGSVTTTLQRRRDGDAQDTTGVYRDGASRKVTFREEYCRYDMNGDGIAELLMVQRVGNKILHVEEVKDGPCEEWCPFPMPHRRVGQSLADKVMDIQRTRSVMMRQAMDNLYQSNMPRILLHEDSVGENTIDDFLTVRPNAFVRWKGGQKPEPWAVPFVAGHAFEAMEILTGERESRTGITRLNQGLDADALNKTATGTALMQAQGQQIEEYIARNFAEFIGRVFAKKYRLMRDYGKPFAIIVDGQPRQVDPSKWPDQMRVNVRVGLGSGRKEQRVQYRLMMLDRQAEARAQGDKNVTDQHIFNSVKGLVADLQLGQGTDFYADPSKPELGPDGQPVQEQEQPDPEQQKAQAEIQAQQAKLQMQQAEFQHKQQMAAQQAQADQQSAMAKLQLEQQQAIARLQLETEKARGEADLARARAQFEAELAQSKMAFEQQMEERRFVVDTEHTSRRIEADREAKMSRNRPGGKLDE